MFQVNVALPSGKSEIFEIPGSSKVGDLKILAQESFGQRFLRLVSAEGNSLLDLQASLQTAGIRDRDRLTAIACQAKVAASRHAFAMCCTGGDRIVTWGAADLGGDSSEIQDQLRVGQIQDVQTTGSAFAAILRDGYVILRDGYVITWGAENFGGDSSLVQDRLKSVQEIQAANRAFAAILANGSVVTWGDPWCGGDMSAVQDQLKNVKQIQATNFAFAAISQDGSVVTWGDLEGGGDSSDVQHQLKGVEQIQATNSAFAAILTDGSVVTWGRQSHGGDSSAVQDQLKSVKQVQATECAFAAIRDLPTTSTSLSRARDSFSMAKRWQGRQACVGRPSVAMLAWLLLCCTLSFAQATDTDSDFDVTCGLSHCVSVKLSETVQTFETNLQIDFGRFYFPSVFHAWAQFAYQMLCAICMIAMPMIHNWGYTFFLNCALVLCRVLSSPEPCTSQAQVNMADAHFDPQCLMPTGSKTRYPPVQPAQSRFASWCRFFAMCFRRHRTCCRHTPQPPVELG